MSLVLPVVPVLSSDTVISHSIAKLGVFNIVERVFNGTPGTIMWMVRGWEEQGSSTHVILGQGLLPSCSRRRLSSMGVATCSGALGPSLRRSLLAARKLSSSVASRSPSPAHLSATKGEVHAVQEEVTTPTPSATLSTSARIFWRTARGMING